MNKKITGLLAATLLFSASQALANDRFIDFASGTIMAGSNKILKVLPASEIVGGTSQYYELKYGIPFSKAANSDLDGRVFVFGDYAPDKNNEVLFGIGASIVHYPTIFGGNDLGFKLGSKVGLGWQDTKGKTVEISNNVNKVSYITQTTTGTPTQAKYDEDNYLFSIGLESGMVYRFSDSLMLNLDLTYKYDLYQVAYRTAANPIVLNALTVRQDNYAFGIGVQYAF